MIRVKSHARLSRILDAATEAFLEFGYRRTRLDEVARRAEVSAGTLYLYAANKESLFQLVLRRALGEALPSGDDLPFKGVAAEELIEWLWDRFSEINRFPVLEAAAASPCPPDPKREMELVLREIWDWQSENWLAIELIERCARDWPELHLLFYKQFRRGVFGLATSLIEQRMEEGAMRRFPDAATAVRVVGESIAFFAMHRHIRPDSAELTEDVCRETVLGILLAGMDPTQTPINGAEGQG